MLQKHFYLSAVGLTIILFVIHGLISYAVNLGVAIFGYWLLSLLRSKHSEKLGFIYLGLSALKFLVFFLAIQPLYLVDGEVTSQEFATFFVPYSFTTTLETLALVRALNRDV
jgi:hypothetical protein